ncbi:YadA-like family protein [Histophilus somni]|uniref:YadA-like family protein n=2 Tax=Histophilus somni TaxID=731 RepID=UPI00201F9425|nr:YadA-like family protein [Histophilus somni]
MNKIFKTKYDVTTGQTKVVSELANNRQVASRVEGASGRQPKCGVFLGMFKILPLALLMSELLSSVAYGVNVWIDVNPSNERSGDNKPSSVWYEKSNVNNKNEVVLLADSENKTGANTSLKNKDFKKTVVIGSRAVGGGNDATAIGYRAIVGKNLTTTNITDSHQGTAVGYRAFSYGNESVSLGNDTVARGSNSIAIGSDNISGENAKPLPKEIFNIFLNNATNFNYTGEYAAVDYSSLFKNTDVMDAITNKNKYVDDDGNLKSEDGFTIGWKGKYYIRKSKNNNSDYYVLIGDQYYEKLSNGNLNPIEKPANIEQMEDYKRMEKYNGYLEEAYKKYLADTNKNKKTHTWARGNNSIAIGGRSVAYGDYSTALGTYAIAYQDYSAAIGTNTIAFGRNSLVFGNNSYVYADRSVGVGTNVQAVNSGSMVYGSDSYSGGSGSLAMGNYALANIAMDENFTGEGLDEGSSKLTFTDNKNRDQYRGKYSFDKFYELGNTKDIQNNRTSIKPKTTKQRGTGEEKAEQSKDHQGKHNQGAIAIGSYTVALGDNALSIGRYAYAKEDSTVAIGRFAFAKEANAFALGSFTRALEKSSIALGNEATATLENSVALGYKSKTDYEHSKSDPYTPEGAIIIPTSANVGVISVGYNGYERRMVNVAAGSQDTDAVNVAQLKALETRIDLNNKQNNLTPYFGVEQKSGDSAKIAQGQEAKQNYERYVKLAGEYAKLLNRKVNGKETFKQEALDKVKKELDALEKSNPQIATKASTIKKIVEDLGKEKGGDGNKLLTKLKEITQAVETDMAKKDQVANLSEQEIEESNYKGSLAKGKDSIAIGYKASVAEVAEDSVAIGKGSKVTAKQEAKNKAEINGVEFTFKGGVSPDNKEESKKTIFSVGDTNQERIIKNVAAGDVSENSTDAINGSQLYAVTKVFSDLAKDVIGVEVDNKQFKKSSFTAVEYISTPTSKKGVPDNFKDALDETIKAINQGYKFSDGTTNNNGTSKYYLGSTLEIKNGDVDGFKGSNLKVKLDTQASNEKATFTIGMSDTPTFKNVTITGSPTNDKHAVNKKYVDDKFKNVATSFKVTGDSGEYVVKDALNIKGKEDTANNKHKNITTTANNSTKKELEISLNSTLKGIDSIGKDENNQITFNGGTTIKAGGAVLSLSKTSDDKVKISGVADGVAENDVVNFKQLEASKLHFLSVKALTTPESKNNYNNDGAIADGAIAIGVGTKATAENAVVIGRDVSIDVKNSFVLGSNNTVTQNFKDTNGAVVVIGSGTKLVESKSSIAIGAVFVKGKNGADGTLIENAAWTASIGNKNKIKNGTDIVALGNNIKALDITNEETKGTKSANTELILIGNGAIAETAKESVLIGAKSNAGKGAKSAVIIGHSAKAEASAVGAVAIGQGATVKTDAGNSIALGQGSEATAKEEAKKDATVIIDGKNIKFTWSAGVSSDNTEGNKKSVLSIGKANNERIIKHVAAGAVTSDSTDAINGSQLYAVADEFSKLAVNVLGAEKADDDTAGFKKSNFEVAKYNGKTTASTPTEMTFKDAIGQNTTAINKGFIFGVGDQPDEYGTHYLGDKLTIKAGNINHEEFKSDNIRTHYEKSNKNILIGIKDKPSFKSVLITEEIPDNLDSAKKGTYDKHAVNKAYLDKRLEKVAANFTVKGDNSSKDKSKVYTLDKDHNELTIAGDSKNIETTVDKDNKKVSIALKEALTGITSIANNDTKIELKNNGGKSIVFTSGDNSKSVTLTGDKFSGVSEISKGNAKLTLGADKATVELEHGKSKLELTNDSATLSAGTDAGSIKINNNGNKKIELSPESGATLTLEKDSTTNSGSKYVKATGLSTVGLSDDNALIFKNNGSKSAELNVGTSATYKFTETGLDLAGKPITNLGSGLGNGAGSGNNDIIEKILSGNPDGANGSPTISNNAVNVKDLSEVARAIVGKGLTFAGNTGSEFTRELGSKITIKGDGTDLTSKAETDAITFTLNKATSVDKNDEKVVTSKAVATELEKYTKTTDLVDKLGTAYLKVDGSNIGKDDEAKKAGRKTFGKNVGIAEIKLGDTEKSSTELVQADAVIKYLKGTGPDSVKISDSTKTMAKGNYSISIGHEAVSENAESIAIGYMTHAQNKKSIALGNESEVLGEKSIAIGTENKIDGEGKYSAVLGIENKVSSQFSYSVGYHNDIKGDNTFVLGSNISTDNSIKNAIILGDRSKGEANAVSVGSDTQQRRIVYVADPTSEYDAVNKQYVDGLGLKFKGNDNQEIHKKLSDTLEIVGKGLNKAQTAKFKGTDGNIAVKSSNGKDKKLEISLNEKLSNIKTIENKGSSIEFNANDKNGSSKTIKNLLLTGNGTKMVLSYKGVHLNEKQLIGLKSGLLEKHNGEDKDRKDLDYLIENVDKLSIKTHAVNVGDLAKISKEIVEKGYKYNADIPSGNSNDTSIKLGSTISIVKLSGTSTNGVITSSQPSTPTINIGDYKGDNLITRYTNESGNAKIEIGFKDAPMFSKVTLSQAQTYGAGSKVDNNDLITKSYLDAALKDFKFNVEYSGQKVQIGRGDTLKFNAGLNIKVELAQNGTTQPSAGSSALASGASSSNSGDSTAGGGNGATSAGTSGSSNMASQGTGATVGSSVPPTTTISNGGAGADSAVASSTTSSSGAGTDGGSGTSSTSSTSSAPSTTTAGTASSTPSTTSNTTAVVTIGTTEDLTGLKSAEFNGDNGNTTNITGNEIVLKDQAGNAHTQTATSQIITDNTDPDTEKAVVTTAEGMTMSVVSDDQVLVNDQTAEANILSNGKHTTEVKAGEVAIKDKSGQEIVSLKVAEGENGQDGKGATLAFAKGTDGKSGTGVITGLKDLDATADGSSAANKNYVDEKVSDLDSNRPFDFYIQEGDDYTKVVKGRDGKFYDPKDLEGAKYDAKSKKYTSQDGQEVTPESDKVIIRAEPTATPIGMNNVASGLGLPAPETDPAKAKAAQEKATALTEAVEEKVKAIGDKAKELSTTAQKVTDLTLAVSGLEMAMSAMPEGEDKKKLQTQLEENKKQLEKAKEELGKAKTALTKAQTELTKANADYEANYKGYDKVADLVKPDSQADLTNVATIADVQAVAKSGLKFKGNDDREIRTPLSGTLAIKGEEGTNGNKFNSDNSAAGNIKVEMAQDGKGLEVKLSDQLKNMTSFETREVDGKKSRLDSNGLQASSPDSETFVNAQGTRITGKGNHAGQSASYTLDGIKLQGKAGEPSLMATHAGLMVSGNNGNIVINGNRGEILIPDVKPDASGFVAVNKNYVDSQNNALRTQIHHADRRLRAGIAGANAAAALASVSMPGKSMVAIAAAGHDGESALAIGYSRISDNGKVMLKLQGNSNSQGKVSGAVSVGYQW